MTEPLPNRASPSAVPLNRMAKKTTSKRTATTRSPKRGKFDANPQAAFGKRLVIVESPTKARTINRYLGSDYHVMASVGHVRDLPKRSPKGVKQPVPGVDLEHDFEPTYEVLPDKKKTVGDLRKAAKGASDVFFATDLDREGEAIAWHLAEALGVDVSQAKRVVFNAITKSEVDRAFSSPRGIDINKVDAQQARRILDRIVGYQVSPLLWKKVAGGLSAGRVQSVATRLVVEREREIEAFVPEEFWRIAGVFAADVDAAGPLSEAWRKYLDSADEKGRTRKEQAAWLSEHEAFEAELVELGGASFKTSGRDTALDAAEQLGFKLTRTDEREDPDAKGPARHPVTYHGELADPADRPRFVIRSIESRRSTTRPTAPFITSTLQQQAANRLGFPLKRTMRVAQQLYEGIDLKGEGGQTGLITYMRTDSTHLSNDAVEMARRYVDQQFGDRYLPEKPNRYTSSNKSAQEAHEAIRPTNVELTPKRVRPHLSDEQFRLYDLIWRRFVACQMTPAQWDGTTILIDALLQDMPDEAGTPAGTFKATGRRLAFDGFYRVMGVPQGDDAILPELREKQELGPLQIDPTQRFTSPPPRYSEASLQKKLEEEGIGRPSTYASIIGTIQDRRYVEPVTPRDKRLRATDLGKVVTDKLVEAFPKIMDVAYTRQMEGQLDQIEEEHKDWHEMLREFYGPFRQNLDAAHESMTHAKAETEPAPHECEKCGAATVYRFGKNGRFLSCSRYPDCKYAAPINARGEPQQPEQTDIICPEDELPMIRRTGRFGPFLAAQSYPEVQFIVKLHPKKGHVVLPKTPPLETQLPCPKCGKPLLLRDSARGLWLSCSGFPKCRGREAWGKLEEDKQTELEAKWRAHEKENPVPEIRTAAGRVLSDSDEYIPMVQGGDNGNASEEAAVDEIAADAA